MRVMCWMESVFESSNLTYTFTEQRRDIQIIESQPHSDDSIQIGLVG